jgi:hypothetical protein
LTRLVRRGGQKPVKTAIKGVARWAKLPSSIVAVSATLLFAMPSFAQHQGQLFAAKEEGYARLILSFPGLDVLPPYIMRIENGVLSLEFTDEISVILPDIGVTLPEYVSVARVDPNGKGLRLGLRSAFNFNRMEAGEQLFIDLLPQDWQGMPPPLPPEVIAELADRARLAAIRAERDRKARYVAELDPKANVRVGRNPTFMRVQFDWTVPTEAKFVQNGANSTIEFEWPVEVDVRDLARNLPEEIAAISSRVTPDGSTISVTMAEGITPRFYETSPKQYVLDVDIDGIALPSYTVSSLGAEAEENTSIAATPSGPEAAQVDKLFPESSAKAITPIINVLGSTVRVVFPFEQDTPAAVFRRGDTVWMLFDTATSVTAPNQSDVLNQLTSEFAVLSSGDAQVVRVELSEDRLATLGSEGMAWVLSLGDIMLMPTEPIEIGRRRDIEGDFEMVANIARPARIHDFRDPLIGDNLKIITAYPPARGVTRNLEYVDFTALRSVHGFVVKPNLAELNIALENELAVISAPGGLSVSSIDAPRAKEGSLSELMRGSYVDLVSFERKDFGSYNRRLNDLQAQAADGEGKVRDQARLQLAQFYVANRFPQESIGVLETLENDLTDKDMIRSIRVTRAIAETLAHRPKDALAILSQPSISQDIDALFWRTIARTFAEDYKGARADALESNAIADNYPVWVRNGYFLAATQSAIEVNDLTMAERFIDSVVYSELTKNDASQYQLLSARIDEGRGRVVEALDTYGQVIAADVRPTRAEAVYRTMKLLDGQGNLDLAKATNTLSAEAMLWRGNSLEADMQTLLADLYFRDGDYRLGFETVRQTVANYPDSGPISELRKTAEITFADLYLNGIAEGLEPVDALSLYYDFRELTPPGPRGDEMIRNLARRLVRVDLLEQAAELLQYQVDNRLKGAAKTQIATDLAVIYLADRKAQEALRVLNNTNLPDLPEALQRQRKVVEARALIDVGRFELALDLLRDMDGTDTALLRIDAHWKAKRYDQASEMLEALYGDVEGPAFDQNARLGMVKAAVGYALANDSFGLSRLRSKFGDTMVVTPEWPMFDLVTSQISITSLEFKTVAAQVSGIEGINAFLSAYRQTYGGDGALAPDNAKDPTAG